MSERDGANNSEIYVTNADGSGQRRLTTDPAGDTQPAWSPDGRRIAFVSDRGDFNSEVYVMKADGSQQLNLTRNPTSDGEPAWSPDGRRIAFSSDRADEDADSGDIYTIDPDGSDARRLTIGNSGSAPTWSPDSRRIAFTATSDSGGSDIAVMARDGSGRMNLTRTATTATGGEEGEPAWSPDRERITFTDIASLDIYSMAANGSRVVRLTADTVTDEEPDWQPRSRSHDSTPPLLNRASLSRKVFAIDRSGAPEPRISVRRKARKGTTFRYRLSEAAQVVVRVERKTRGRRAGGRCRTKAHRNRLGRRCKHSGSFIQAGRAGRNRERFSGKIGDMKLRPGCAGPGSPDTWVEGMDHDESGPIRGDRVGATSWEAF